MITSIYMQVSENIRSATDLHFPASSGVKLIAEPGQFFITSCYALVVQVIGKRRSDIVVDGMYVSHCSFPLAAMCDCCSVPVAK